MIQIKDRSISISGAAWGGASVSFSADCTDKHEAKALFETVEAFTRGIALFGKEDCKRCLLIEAQRREDNRQFEDARVRFEQVAARIRSDQQQSERTIINLRNELRGQGDDRVTAAQQQAQAQLRTKDQEIAQLKSELTTVKAALAKEIAREMPASPAYGNPAYHDSSGRFSKLEID